MVSPYQEKLHDQITRFAEMKRMYKFIFEVFNHFKNQQVKNDLLYRYHFLAVDGLVLELTNSTDQLVKFLNYVSSNYLSEIRRNRAKRILESEPIASDPNSEISKKIEHDIAKRQAAEFERRYDQFFPKVKNRNKGYPNIDDIEEHINELINVMKPIELHRNTAVAHRCEEPQRATFNDFTEAFDHLENLLSNLLCCSFWTSHSTNILGGSDIEATAKLLCEEMLGS